MMKSFYDLIADILGFLKDLVLEIGDMINDLKKDPVVSRVTDDVKGFFGSFFSSVGRAVVSGSSSLKDKLSRSKSNEIMFQIVLWGALAGFVLFLMMSAVVFEVADRWDNNLYTVNIPSGFGAGDVADLLLEKGIIANRYGFNSLMGFYGLENRIQAGVYKFSPSMGLAAVVMKLKKGDVISPPLSRVIFPEGTSIYKMSLILKDQGIGTPENFEQFLDEPILPDLKDKFPFLSGIKNDSLEGYLFPDTYLAPPGISILSLRDMMLSRFASQVMPLWRTAMNDTGLSFNEIITLASIIEKEAAIDEERPIISSVFHNRLNKHMHLSADPTVKYALSEFRRPTKRVYYIDLEVNSPYNTYKYLGLPPGPICNPGLASIKAAIYPAKTNYLYFVARKDGTHIFSATWQDHERAKVLVRGE